MFLLQHSIFVIKLLKTNGNTCDSSPKLGNPELPLVLQLHEFRQVTFPSCAIASFVRKKTGEAQ
jgi:hypothetical protein